MPQAAQSVSPRSQIAHVHQHEIRFLEEVVERFQVHDRIVDGCWILIPPVHDFYKKRRAFFLHPLAEHSPSPPVRPPRPVTLAALSLKNLGIESCYAVPYVQEQMPFEWRAIDITGAHVSENPAPIEEFMGDFPRRRVRQGRRRTSRAVVNQLNRNLRGFPRDYVLRVLGKQLFLDYLSQSWVGLGTTDVDYFLFGGKFGMPVEIKEKTPASDDKIGGYLDSTWHHL